MSDAATKVLELGALGLDEGASVLLRLTLAELGAGERLAVRGSAPDLAVHLRAWARAEGHDFALAAALGIDGAAHCLGEVAVQGAASRH